MKKLITLRHKLHTLAELSGEEKNTSSYIAGYLKKLQPDALISIGNHGKAAIFQGSGEGPVTLFRADIDALPIPEDNALPYKSLNENVSHRCGHDGHTAILLGFANYCALHTPKHGKIVLLFQPAEETGQGAMNVISDPAFQALKPDFSFALHNLPGYPSGCLVVREGVFAAASKGMIIKLQGASSHASEPEKGNSPVSVLPALMQELPLLANPDVQNQNFSLATIVHANLGKPEFGITPSEAKLILTLRAYKDEVLLDLDKSIQSVVDEKCRAENISYSFGYQDVFPATINHSEAVHIIRTVAKEDGVPVIGMELPFKWSEDFAHFTALSRGALFGIGCGSDHPPLHSTNYDFNDEIIDTGFLVWRAIYNKLHR